jgi:YhcH/YjgK/YiaL family protein
MAFFGSIGTVRGQAAPAAAFAATFAYLEEVFRPGSPAAGRLEAVPAGETRRVDLDGGAFALEQAYFAKRRTDGFFESHRNYIDVQVIFSGEEVIEVVDLARTTEKQAYQPERDLIVYADVAGASPLRLRAGDAAVFFPADVHMPGLKVGDEPGLVRKTVIKVPVAALQNRGG